MHQKYKKWNKNSSKNYTMWKCSAFEKSLWRRWHYISNITIYGKRLASWWIEKEKRPMLYRIWCEKFNLTVTLISWFFAQKENSA